MRSYLCVEQHIEQRLSLSEAELTAGVEEEEEGGGRTKEERLAEEESKKKRRQRRSRGAGVEG